MTIRRNCRQCGAPGALAVGQSLRPDLGLAWWESSNCPRCSAVYEADDHGFPPDELRRALLLADGLWLVVVPESARRVAVGQVARELLGYPLQAAAKLMRSLPGVVWRGTEVEARWFAAHLTAAGVRAEIRRSAPGEGE